MDRMERDGSTRRDVLKRLGAGIVGALVPETKSAHAESLKPEERAYFDWAATHLSLAVPYESDERTRWLTEMYSRMLAASEENDAIRRGTPEGQAVEGIIMGDAHVTRDDVQRDLFRGHARFATTVDGRELIVQLNILVRGEAGKPGSLERCSVVFSSGSRLGSHEFAVEWSVTSDTFAIQKLEFRGFVGTEWVTVTDITDKTKMARLFDGALARLTATG